MKVNRLYLGKDIKTMNRKELLAIVEDFLNMFTIEIEYSLQPEKFTPREKVELFGTSIIDESTRKIKELLNRDKALVNRGKRYGKVDMPEVDENKARIFDYFPKHPKQGDMVKLKDKCGEFYYSARDCGSGWREVV